MPFVISLWFPKRAKVIRIITILRYFEAAIVVEQFWIVPNKQNKILEIRIFSYLLNFFHFFLIHFSHSRDKLYRKCPPPQHISRLKKTFKNYKPMSLFSNFCGTLFYSIHLIFSFTELQQYYTERLITNSFQPG